MPAVVAAIYLLLALRVRITLEGAFCGRGGSVALSAGAAGIYVRFDGEIRKEKQGVFFALVPRYAAHAKQKKTKETHSKSLRIIRTYLWLARTGKIEQLSADIRVGMGDAGGTAVAAGCLQALASSVLLRAGRQAAVDLHVSPDYECASFAAYSRCVFSCQPGDIMLAAFRYALKKRKNTSHAYKTGGRR